MICASKTWHIAWLFCRLDKKWFLDVLLMYKLGTDDWSEIRAYVANLGDKLYDKGRRGMLRGGDMSC